MMIKSAYADRESIKSGSHTKNYSFYQFQYILSKLPEGLLVKVSFAVWFTLVWFLVFTWAPSVLVTLHRWLFAVLVTLHRWLFAVLVTLHRWMH